MLKVLTTEERWSALVVRWVRQRWEEGWTPLEASLGVLAALRLAGGAEGEDDLVPGSTFRLPLSPYATLDPETLGECLDKVRLLAARVHALREPATDAA
jgi:hypothetical protein